MTVLHVRAGFGGEKALTERRLTGIDGLDDKNVPRRSSRSMSVQVHGENHHEHDKRNAQNPPEWCRPR